ncbi:MAG: hypothetical protein ACI4TJ_04325, partial [Candidatus Cryptobacteroides sp.]
MHTFAGLVSWDISFPEYKRLTVSLFAEIPWKLAGDCLDNELLPFALVIEGGATSIRLSSSSLPSVNFEKDIDGHNTLATHTLFPSL